jgi:NB-ARC domain
MPGVGKTQLAQKYGRLAFEEQQVPFVFWISASSSDKLEQSFTSILNLIRHRDRHSTDQTAKLIAARLWLEDSGSQTKRKWLLILDNATRETISSIRDMIPRSNPGGHILITTRTKDVATTLAQSPQKTYHYIELSQLPVEDAAKLLIKSSRKEGAIDESVVHEAEDIVRSIGCLPLAIDQAGSFLRETECSAVELLGIYNSDQVNKVRELQIRATNVD